MGLALAPKPDDGIGALELEAVAIAAKLAEARRLRAAEEKRLLADRAAPMHAAEAEIAAQLAKLDDQAHDILRNALAEGRALYADATALHAKLGALRGQRQSLTGEAVPHYPLPTFVTFVTSAVRRFDGRGFGDASGPAWARGDV